MWLFTEITDYSVCIWRSITGLIGIRGLWQDVIGIRLDRKKKSVLGRCSGVEMSWFYYLPRTDYTFYLLPKFQIKEYVYILK